MFVYDVQKAKKIVFKTTKNSLLVIFFYFYLPIFPTKTDPPVTACFITHSVQTSPQTFAEIQVLKKQK